TSRPRTDSSASFVRLVVDLGRATVVPPTSTIQKLSRFPSSLAFLGPAGRPPSGRGHLARFGPGGTVVAGLAFAPTPDKEAAMSHPVETPAHGGHSEARRGGGPVRGVGLVLIIAGLVFTVAGVVAYIAVQQTL